MSLRSGSPDRVARACVLGSAIALFLAAPEAQAQHDCFGGGNGLTASSLSPDATVVPGMLRVRLRERAARGPAFALRGATRSAAVTGLAAVDSELRRAGLRQVRRRGHEPADARLASALGITRDLYVYVDPSVDVEALAKRVAALPDVEAAVPNRILRIATVPNDPSYPAQWGHDNQGQAVSLAGGPVGTVGFDTSAELAWDGPQRYGEPFVIIAVIDTGVQLDHPDLRRFDGYDFIEDDPDPQPDGFGNGSHGTKVAGMAAARANNGIGVAGSCGSCSVMPFRVSIFGGAIVSACVDEAIVYAVDHGARVINMSFGDFSVGVGDDPMLDLAIDYAWLSDVVLFAAAGNNNGEGVWYPAANPRVIAVGAASPCGGRKRSGSDPLGASCDGEAWGSNWGPEIELLAPGVANPTTKPGSGYDLHFFGTSSASPYAAGVAGLVLSRTPWLTASQVRQVLRDTAVDVTIDDATPGVDDHSGYGMVNAAAAVAMDPAPECSNGVDDDDDGLVDHGADPGCGGAPDGSYEAPECSDGFDNDLDGLVDHPADGNCSSPADDLESPPACGLGFEAGIVALPLASFLRARRRRRSGASR